MFKLPVWLSAFAVTAIVSVSHMATAEPVPLKSIVANKNNVTVQVLSIERGPVSTTLGMRVINGKDTSIELNDYTERSTFLRLSDDTKLYIIPPQGNSEITIPSYQTVEGTFTFPGILPENTSKVELVINDGSTFKNSPQFTFSIPLSASNAAVPLESDSKKN